MTGREDWLEQDRNHWKRQALALKVNYDQVAAQRDELRAELLAVQRHLKALDLELTIARELLDKATGHPLLNP